MKLSETFEGDNSSLKKTFEEVVYEATPFSPGVLTVGGPAQKEEWDIAQKIQDLYFDAGAVVDIHTWNKTKELISLAEQRGREAQQKVDYEIAKTQQEKAFKSGTEMGEKRGREATITLFEEFAKDNESNNKGYGEDGYVTLTDLLSFAGSLKSNAPKV